VKLFQYVKKVSKTKSGVHKSTYTPLYSLIDLKLEFLINILYIFIINNENNFNIELASMKKIPPQLLKKMELNT